MRTSPRFLFLQTNQRCNLRCTHCHYWKKDDSDSENYISRQTRRMLMGEFKALGGETVVTCGGEPMLDTEVYFGLCADARQTGLKLFSVINGTRVSTANMALRMVEEGPTAITVSLDHWKAEEHDRLRGVKGSHAAAVRAIKFLVAAGTMRKPYTPIYAMTILSEDTWRTLDRFYEFAYGELCVNKLKLNVAQPTFQGSGCDEYFEGSRITDIPACMATIRKCDAEFGIRRNPQWLADVEMYFRSVNKTAQALKGWSGSDGTEEAICNSYDRNIMVDVYGYAGLCFSPVFPHFPVTEPGELTRLWNTQVLRDCMVGCKRFCGISHSVRASESTLK